MAVLFNLSSVLPVYILLLLNGLVRSSSNFGPCQHGYFYEKYKERCRPCSECPANQIIHTPCSNISDVKCEPFSIPDFQSSNSAKNRQRPYVHNDFDKNDHVEGTVVLRGDDDSYSETEASGSNPGPATVEKEDKEYWKKLALALIGALSVLIVVATVIVIVAWAKVHKAAIVKLPEDGDMDDADSGYVVIRSIRHMALPRSNTPAARCYAQDGDDARPPLLQSQSTTESCRSASSSLHQQHSAPGSLCYLPKVYKPQRRLLNYDADDVFESDDNSAYCPNQRITSLQTQSGARNLCNR